MSEDTNVRHTMFDQSGYSLGVPASSYTLIPRRDAWQVAPRVVYGSDPLEAAPGDTRPELPFYQGSIRMTDEMVDYLDSTADKLRITADEALERALAVAYTVDGLVDEGCSIVARGPGRRYRKINF